MATVVAAALAACSGATATDVGGGGDDGGGSDATARDGSRSDDGSTGTGTDDGGAPNGDAGTAPPDAAAGTCASDHDCASGQACAFAIADGCSAVGTCFTKPPPGPTCAAYEAACTCSGDTINVACTIFPSGTASAPVAHSGECTGGVADAGSFSCGMVTCSGDTVCKVINGDTATGSCVAFPAACSSNRTCACVKSQLGGSTCTESGGRFTVKLVIP